MGALPRLGNKQFHTASYYDMTRLLLAALKDSKPNIDNVQNNLAMSKWLALWQRLQRAKGHRAASCNTISETSLQTI
jgi:hypothetical protein